jgi:hypothetical protein
MERIEEISPYLKELSGIKHDELKKAISICKGDGWDEIDILAGRFNYFLKPRREGILEVSDRGRYTLDECEFTCGDSIEIFVIDEEEEKDHWVFGRVEHSTVMGGYYFTGDGMYRLKPGMKVAVRR